LRFNVNNQSSHFGPAVAVGLTDSGKNGIRKRFPVDERLEPDNMAVM
jgi:hypothetical protein